MEGVHLLRLLRLMNWVIEVRRNMNDVGDEVVVDLRCYR